MPPEYRKGLPPAAAAPRIRASQRADAARIRTMIARTAVLFALAIALLPDEGQWLPTQVRDWDWDALQRRGMRMTKDEFWHTDRGGVLSATVQINGCTASFVSADGLLVTNHHCGFDAVSQLSSVEHNWLRDGFAA